MRKEQKKELQKGWKRLKTAFKWILILIILCWLLALLKDFLGHYTLLVKKVTDEGNTIDSLKVQLQSLKQTNLSLSNQIQVDHMKIQHLQQGLNIKINGHPIAQPQVSHDPALNIPQVPMVPMVLVGALTILGSLLHAIPAL